MAFDQYLAQRIRDALIREPGITEKKMFGGIAFLLNGKMLVGIIKDSLVARIGPDSYDGALEEPFVGEFDFTGRPMRGWVVIEPDGIEDDERLKEWIAQAMKFVAALPAK